MQRASTPPVSSTADPAPAPAVPAPVAEEEGPSLEASEGAPPTVSASPAPLLGEGPPLAPRPDLTTAPQLLTVADDSSVFIQAGTPRMWGDHPEHVPYRVEGYGPISLGVSDAVQVVLRGPSATVLRADGRVVEFDQDERGGSRRDLRAPRMRFLAGSGGPELCGVTQRGEVYCWGGFASGEAPVREGAPPRAVRRLTGVRSVAIQAQAGVALLADGTVRTFGFGTADALGVGGHDETDSYVEEANRVERPALTEVVEVSAGAWTFCALRSDGTVWCWGERPGARGQVDATPTALPGIDGVITLHQAPNGLCVRRRDASVACVGELPDGLVRSGELATPQARFVSAAVSGVRELAVGDAHACWLGDEGVRCVGRNTLGELGVMPRRSAVLAVPGVRGARWVRGGAHQVCAGTRTGVFCWGGQVIGPESQRVRSLAIARPGTVRDVWIRGHQGCVLRDSGLRECYLDLFDGSGPASSLAGVAGIAGACALMTETHAVVCGTGSDTVAGPVGPFLSIRASSGHPSTIAAVHADALRVERFTFEEPSEGRAPTVTALGTVAFAEAPSDVAPYDSGLCARVARTARCGGRSVGADVDELAADGLVCTRTAGVVRCSGYIDAPQLMAMSGIDHPDVNAAGELPGLRDATALTVGAGHVCALRATGEVACFGDSRSGAVGGIPAWIAVEPVTPEL